MGFPPNYKYWPHRTFESSFGIFKQVQISFVDIFFYYLTIANIISLIVFIFVFLKESLKQIHTTCIDTMWVGIILLEYLF